MEVVDDECLVRLQGVFVDCAERVDEEVAVACGFEHE